MHPVLNDITSALRQLSDKILGATAEDRPLTEVYGWQAPAVTRRDLSWYPLALSNKITAADANLLPPQMEEDLKAVPGRLALLHGTTIPQIFSGNYSAAISAYLLTLDTLEKSLEPILGWEQLSESKAIPSKLHSRLRSMQSAIDEMVPDKERLENQIKLIEEATLTAESLPTDLQALKSARQQVSDTATDVAEKLGKIKAHEEDAAKRTASMKQWDEEAKKITDQAKEVLRVATSTGLAAAFEDRAISLTNSMWGWVVGLVAALGSGVWIGLIRYKSLEASLTSSELNWGIIAIQLVLSLFSVAAPVWLAWLSTKQIAQRFRLSEDYAFKASVAKAYEGYRREAARIDSELEEKLFISALTRFDEAPLRLVETETHGSPFHELITSEAFLLAVKAFPELAKTVSNISNPKKIKGLVLNRKSRTEVNGAEESETTEV